MDYALVFKWTRPIAGREAKALEVLADLRMYFGKLSAEGTVDEPIVLMQINDGMMIVRGDMKVLSDIINRDDFITLMDKGLFVAEGFRFETFFTGELMEHRLGLYAEAGKELAYF